MPICHLYTDDSVSRLWLSTPGIVLLPGSINNHLTLETNKLNNSELSDPH